MKNYSIFSMAVILLGLLSGNASDAVRLNEHGFLFPLSRYSDWNGRTVQCQKPETSMAVVFCKGSPKRIGISSKKLEKELSEVHLPDWEYSEITLPALIAPCVSAPSLQVISGDKKQISRYTFIMHGPDGKLRTYLNKTLFSRVPGHEPLKLSKLKNFYFSYRANSDTTLKFGDLQMNLRGKTALTSVPVVDAGFIDHVPGEEDWKEAPVFKEFTKTLKAPTTAKFLHDPKCIYIRFDQKTDTSKLVSKQNRDGQIWRDDSFQILFSPGNDNRSYHQIIVNPAGVSQSYHYVFDQVADTFIRPLNIRVKEWDVKVDKKADSWSAVFTIQKTLLDKFINEPIHGLQLFVDNQASGGGKAFLRETDRIYLLSEAGVLRLLAKGQPASKPFPEKPALFFLHGNLLTGVPGDFEIRLACPAAKITGAKAKDFYSLPSYTGSSGIQRFTIYNNETGCIFAGKTESLHWNPKVAYGTRVLVPEPKTTVWSKEKLPAAGLTLFYSDKTEKAVSERLTKIWSGFLQTDLVSKAAQLPANTIVIGKNQTPAKSAAVTQDEGYALVISENGITIRGKDAAGLSHGVSTLEQLARYAMLRNEDFLPGVTITDWPDVPNRLLHRWIDSCYWQLRKQFIPYADTYDEVKEGMYDLAYRFAILNKLNYLSLRSPLQVFYETPVAKKMNRKTTHLTWKEMRDYAAFCRKYHLDIIPAIQSASHANYLLTNNFPQMILKGYGRGDADPEHPDFWKYLNAARGEWIDQLQPKYFETCNDEWWHYPQGKVEVTRNGRPMRDIFRETILKEHQFITGEKKVRMMMDSDMLQPNHNGGKPFDNYLNLDKLPRDIVMMNWSGGEAGVKLFTDLGYTVWGLFNLSAMGKLNPEKINHDPKFQGIGCTLTGSNGDPEGSYGTQSVITTAEEAWNFYSKKHTTMNDWLSEKGEAVMPMYSVQPNPAAGRTFKTVPLSGMKTLPAPFKAVPGGKQTVGFIPMELSAGQGIKTSVKPFTVNVNSKASSLIFLQAELVTAKPPIINARSTRWFQGIKSTIYTIHYADGKTLDIYARHAVNTGSALPRRGKTTGEVQNRCLHDVRYLWPLMDGKTPFYLYQWEWVNPRPQVEIRSISCRNLENILPGVTNYLFALTLRENKK